MKSIHRQHTILTCIFILALAFTMQPATAHATAYTSATWGNFGITINNIPVGISRGEMNAVIRGDRLKVDAIVVAYRTFDPTICNWHFTASFYDKHGTVYRRESGPTWHICSPAGAWHWNPPGSIQMKPGLVRISLWTHFHHRVSTVKFALH